MGLNIKTKIVKSAISGIVSEVTEETPKLIGKIATSVISSKKGSKDRKESAVRDVAIVSNGDSEVAGRQETDKPKSVWEAMGCSEKTIGFIKVAMSDGVIDDKDHQMLQGLIKDDGVDPAEFNYMLAKATEEYQKTAKSVIKQLSAAFDLAEKMAKKEEKPNEKELNDALPALISMATGGTLFAMASAAGLEGIGKAIGRFVKEPSKLNRFKAEIIRMVDIPLFPEVIVDFCSYAQSQLIQEQQKLDGKGLFTQWSDSLFGKDVDLVPIWKEKMGLVLDKATTRYGNSPEIMALFVKWRDTPLKRLMGLTNKDEIMMFPSPPFVSDLIDLLQYSFNKSQEDDNPMKEAHYKLYSRLYRDGQSLASQFECVRDVLDEYRIRPIHEFISNSSNQDYLAMFNAPENQSDLLEVLQYLKSRSDLKHVHKRVYKQALKIYGDDQEIINDIRTYKPGGFLGL